MFKRLTDLWLAWRALTSRKLRLPQKGEKWEAKTSTGCGPAFSDLT